MSDGYWWIPFGINFILYGICCLLILKRKHITIISIRSPTLLLCTIFGNFLTSLVIILFEITGQNFFSSFYYLFRILMMVSIFLRYERIILCCGINKNDAADIKQFYNRRYIYIEKFYMRILIFCFAFFLVATIIVRALDYEYFEIFFSSEEEILSKTKMWIWVIYNFIEDFLLVTYLFRLYDILDFPNQYIKFELYIFVIIWFIYSNFCSGFGCHYRNEIDDKSNIFSILSLTVLYISLILNGMLPIIMSFTPKTLVTYHFTPKLLNNLYLFLTDEICYKTFNNYLCAKKDNGPILLKLYTYIMRYKLTFVLNQKNLELGFMQAVEINNTFFENESNANKLNNEEVVIKVKAECNILNNHNFTKNMFDEALKYVFNELNNRFLEFKSSREYNELQAKIILSSYIRCKMTNTGLINKF